MQFAILELMENDISTVTYLNKEDFKLALAKGQGRAKLYVTHYGLENVSDLVLNTCIHDLAYDPQSEDGRVDWLFSMFNGSNYYPKFRETILGALANETDTYDLLQLCQLAKEMAASGDILARQALRVRVMEIAGSPSDHDWVGADEWIELEGVEGMLDLARTYGQRLLQDSNDFVYDSLSFLEKKYKADFKNILLQYSKQEPSVKAYWNYLKKRGVLKRTSTPVDRETRKERFRRKYTLERILYNAQTGVGEIPGYYVIFGRYATSEELEEIYTRLLNETDESAQLRLLWIFRRTPMPRLNAVLFKWAMGANEALRTASIAALAQLSDEKIHDLARFKAKNSQLLGADCEAIDLFIYNYDSSDAYLIKRALLSVDPNAEEVHSLGSSVLELVEQQEDRTLTDALKWVYEYTPCTNCRYSVIVQLDKFQQFDHSLIQECLFDASKKIREFAQECANKVFL